MIAIEESIKEITRDFAEFVAYIKGINGLKLYDINTITETALLPIFREVFGYTNLKNLNFSDDENYPAIDLGDRHARVSFQVTSTSGINKVIKTLETFQRHSLEEVYDQVFIYIITEKKDDYSSQKLIQLSNSFNAKCSFNPKSDILDYRDLIKKISKLSLERLGRIREIVKDQLSRRKHVNYLIGSPQVREAFPKENISEKIVTNLLPVSFPKSLYIADLELNKKEIIEKSQNHEKPLSRKSKTRDVIFSALHQSGQGVSGDWINFRKQLITFHDLSNPNSIFRSVIDPGTVTEVSPLEFYEENNDKKYAFVTLLKACLRKRLFHQRIKWNFENRLFIFTPRGDDIDTVRKETWYQKKKATRKVFQPHSYINSKKEEITYYEHLAFRVRFLEVSDEWYLQITPDWYFSWDGWKKYFYSKEKVIYKKKVERNKAVYNHLQFIVSKLRSKPSLNMFVSPETQEDFLEFGKIVSFDSHPLLNDQHWLNLAESNEKRHLNDPEEDQDP